MNALIAPVPQQARKLHEAILKDAIEKRDSGLVPEIIASHVETYASGVTVKTGSILR